MGAFTFSGGSSQPPPENALDALLDELKTFSKPFIQNNEKRPDDSTSDESAQAVQSTVTTQISQARLYTQNDANNVTQLQSHIELQTSIVPDSGITLTQSRINNNSSTLLVHSNAGSLRRLHSYPSGSDTDVSPTPQQRVHTKPPVPERSAELITKAGNKRIPPPPPPRTSSRSPLASPTSPNVPQTLPTLNENDSIKDNYGNADVSSGDNSSGNESGNDNVQRKVALEMRHQELLKKQKILQEQYLRLQQMSKLPTADSHTLPIMKAGSESNIQHKIALTFVNLPTIANDKTDVVTNNGIITSGNDVAQQQSITTNSNSNATISTTKQIYETEIL